jgi:hypothetical protein
MSESATCDNTFENQRGERFVCELRPNHPGPHESGNWEWWNGGPEVRQYGEHVSEILKRSSKSQPQSEAPLREIRIHVKREAEMLEDGVNLSSGIHFDYVIFFRTEGDIMHISEVVIPKANPREYSFYESRETRR